MSLPLNVIIKSIEEPDTIIPILKSLNDVIYSLKASKAEINHLASRTLNLTSSHQPFYKWCGVLLIQILSRNYEILTSQGSKFISSLLKILETTNVNTDLKLFNATVECLNSVCNNIRGKPTLTRELLTPKLPVIIQNYLDNLDMNPTLIISSLSHIMINHSTTFRPFGNKLNRRLVDYLKQDFHKYPQALRNEITKTFALLPIIEKTEPEVVWANKLNNSINELVDTASVFQDLVDFKQDSKLSELIKDQRFKLDDSNRIFDFLQIDISKPETLLQLSNRIQVLCEIIIGFSENVMPLCVKFPIGRIIQVADILISINTKFLPIRRDIRDVGARNLIVSITRDIHSSALKVVSGLVINFSSSMVRYLSNILSLLETTIPMTKSTVNHEEILTHESFSVGLIETVDSLLQVVNLYQEPQILVRFVDTALALVEPRVSDLLSNGEEKNGASNKKKNKRKTTGDVPIADLLSHGHLFNAQVPANTVNVVRKFFTTVTTRMELPSTQYYKIMRYITVAAISYSTSTRDKNVPEDLRQLLVNAVIYPGFEKVSILPIVSNILGDDPLISVFTNPRFPPLPKFIHTVKEEDFSDEEMEIVEEPAEEVTLNIAKRPVVDEIELSESKRTKIETETEIPQVTIEDTVKLPSPVAVPESIVEFKEEVKSKEVVNEPSSEVIEQVTTTSTSVTSKHMDDGDDSDFEMPEININDSEDDE